MRISCKKIRSKAGFHVKSFHRQLVRPTKISFFIENRLTMIQLRTNRTRTSFYTPALATEIQPQPQTRNKLWNPKTRRWILDTPRNRYRLSQSIPKPKIRNPKTGRMILATPRNIRSSEAFRSKRVQQMIQNQAAFLITSKIHQFRENQRRRNLFTLSRTLI